MSFNWDEVIRMKYTGASPEMQEALIAVEDRAPCKHEWTHRNDHGEDSEDGYLLSCEKCGIHLEDVNEGKESAQLYRYVTNHQGIEVGGILLKLALKFLEEDGKQGNKLRGELAALIKENTDL